MMQALMHFEKRSKDQVLHIVIPFPLDSHSDLITE